MKKLYIKKVRDVKSPTRAHKWDAGLDLYLPEDFDISNDSNAIPLGISIALPKGYMAQVIERSSIGKKGFIFAKSPIDSGYTGEIHLIIPNYSRLFKAAFKAGDKVAQLVITKIETPKIKEVSELRETERGSNGFGSTDKK